MRGARRWARVSDLARVAKDDVGLAGRAVQAALARVDALDGELGAFLHVSRGEVTPRAGTLTAVPVAVKDNIAVRGMPLTCGSRSLEGFLPTLDATAVSRLRDAGAVVIGKTNLDEFAMGSSCETSSYRPCRNPWVSDVVPGGSSGGSAAAVAAGMVPVALGSDTGGSVRQPAAFCGVVGFKPSYGVVSRSGLVSYASSLDQIGVISTRVADGRCVFDVIRGPDESDDTVRAFDAQAFGSMDTLRVGVIDEYGHDPSVEPEVRAAIAEATELFRELGASVADVSIPALDETVLPAYYLTATAEASSNLARFDGVRFGKRLGVDSPDAREMVRQTRRLLGPEVKLRIVLGTFALRAGHYDQLYGRAQLVRRRIAEGFARAFRNVDVLLTPTASTRAFKIGEMIDDPVQMKLADLFTVTANLAGLPAISLPVSVEGGLPTAVHLMAPRFHDHHLLDVAEALEERLGFDGTRCPMVGQGPAVGCSLEVAP